MTIMIFVQGMTVFSFFLLVYLVTHFDQIYSTAFISLVFEFIAAFISGMVIEKFGTRISFIVFYGFAALGGILMLSYGLNNL